MKSPTPKTTMTTSWVFQNIKTEEEYEYDTEGFDEALNYLAEDLGDDYVPADWQLIDSYWGDQLKLLTYLLFLRIKVTHLQSVSLV
mgnify:CR=1 FL=1